MAASPSDHGTLPCVHIGYHKSASTTLQMHLFARHPQLLYVGKRFRSQPAKELKRAVLAELPPAIHGDSLSNGRSACIWSDLRRQAVSDHRVLMLSWEKLSKYTRFTNDPTRMANGLQSLIGPARILIVVRHPVRLMESYYLFRVTRTLKRPNLVKLQRTLFPIYRYAAVADAYVGAFGPANVALMMFEELSEDPEGFARRVCRFLGLDGEVGAELIHGGHEHADASRALYRYARLRSAIQPRGRSKRTAPLALTRSLEAALRRGPPPKIRLPARFVEALEDLVRDDCRHLAARYGLPIERYGYPS